MKQIDKNYNDITELIADDGCYLHRIDSDDHTPLRQVATDDPTYWEELPLSERPAYTRSQYAAEVERLIAERYSHGKEIEVNREAATKPEQFAAYLAYIDECKERAKEILQTSGTLSL